MICRPRGPYAVCQSINLGISTRQGPHQVAQKLSRTTLPRYAWRSNLLWLISVRTNSGALLCTSPSAAKAGWMQIAIRHKAGSQAVSTRRRSANCNLPQTSGPDATSTDLHCSATVFNRITSVNPVCAEIISKIKDFDVGVAQLVQLLECRSYVGTMVPWATTAIEHDELFVR